MPREVNFSRCANEGENLAQWDNKIPFCDQASLCFSLEKDGGRLCFEGYDEGEDLIVLCSNTRVCVLLVPLSLTGIKVRLPIQKWKQTMHIALEKKNPTCKQKCVFRSAISIICFLFLQAHVNNNTSTGMLLMQYLPHPFHSCRPHYPTNAATPPSCPLLPHSVLLTFHAGDEY